MKDLQFIEGDLRDRDLLAKALEGVEVVFHEAAVPSVPRSVAEPERTNDVNVTGNPRTPGGRQERRSSPPGLRRLFRRLRQYAPLSPRSRRCLRCRSRPMHSRNSPVRPTALSTPASTAWRTVALRYFNVYGPRQNPESEYAAVIPKFVTACLGGRSPEIYGDGEQTRDFTFVGDVVQANLLAAESKDAVGTVVNVAGGGRISLNQLLETVQEVCGSSTETIYHPARAGDVRDSQADLTRARATLGFEPATSMGEGSSTDRRVFSQGPGRSGLAG